MLFRALGDPARVRIVNLLAPTGTPLLHLHGAYAVLARLLDRPLTDQAGIAADTEEEIVPGSTLNTLKHSKRIALPFVAAAALMAPAGAWAEAPNPYLTTQEIPAPAALPDLPPASPTDVGQSQATLPDLPRRRQRTSAGLRCRSRSPTRRGSRPRASSSTQGPRRSRISRPPRRLTSPGRR